jgi:GNAT superfamily N-acetyltransferase
MPEDDRNFALATGFERLDGDPRPVSAIPDSELLAGFGTRRDREGVRITARRGRGKDAREAAELYLRARKAAVGVIPNAVHGDDEVRRWFASHVVTETEPWLAEDDAAVVVGLMVLDGDWVDQLYVEPDLTGRGVGARLLDVAKRRRPDGLQLWTFASNAGAQRFYERHGFVARERTDGSENEERAPAIRYSWSGLRR